MLVSHIHNTSTSNQLVFMFPTPYSIRVLEGWHSGKDSNLESRFWRPMVQPLTDRCILLAGYILARRVGFEPTDGFPPPVFKTGAIDHSATSAYFIFVLYEYIFLEIYSRHTHFYFYNNNNYQYQNKNTKVAQVVFFLSFFSFSIYIIFLNLTTSLLTHVFSGGPDVTRTRNLVLARDAFSH